MNRSMKLNAACLVALAINSACASGLAPRELLDARDAYNKAKAGVANQYSLAELETAKQSLQEAESAFRDGEEEGTKNLAYIAERRAQLAEAAGALEEANRERLAAIKRREDAQQDYRKRTQKELTAAQKALEERERQIAEGKRKTADATKELGAERTRRLAAERKAAAALASLEQLAQVKEEKRGVVITLSGSVLFATGKSELLPIAKEKLNEVAKALTDQGYKSIVVEGHTDSRGGESSNRQLSERRAGSVRAHLVGQGITANKITALGKGEGSPVASNSTAEGRANNRRVELVVQPE